MYYSYNLRVQEQVLEEGLRCSSQERGLIAEHDVPSLSGSSINERPQFAMILIMRTGPKNLETPIWHVARSWRGPDWRPRHKLALLDVRSTALQTTFKVGAQSSELFKEA